MRLQNSHHHTIYIEICSLDKLKKVATNSHFRYTTQDMMITIDKCLCNKAPQSVKSLISLRQSNYNLRGDYILNLPKVNSTKNGLKTWRYYAAKQWNSLPNKIRAMTGRKEFSEHIRAFEFN